MELEQETIAAERDSWKEKAEVLDAERASLERRAHEAEEERDEVKELLSAARSYAEETKEELDNVKHDLSAARFSLQTSEYEYQLLNEEVEQKEKAHQEELEAAKAIPLEVEEGIIADYKDSPQFKTDVGSHFRGQFESFLKGLVLELQQMMPSVNLKSLAPVYGFIERRAEEAAQRLAEASSQVSPLPLGSPHSAHPEEENAGPSGASGPSGTPQDGEAEGEHP